ncbi:MAG: outer membrane lipoprotein-sorting protein [Bacteroidales bacterium]|nr:outer membrane lipoprotein-sorting protein [Bacteroidales bacterium]
MLFFIQLQANGQQLSAYEIVKKADDKLRGEQTGYAEMTMEIIRPTWNRTVAFKSWNMETEYSLVLITGPPKEEGQSFLKRGNDMWNWNPTINRMIKLPPSMLAQGWMGSDFTNDDLLNQSSIVVDYTHTIISEETITGRDCYVIELIPEEDAPVVWGKVILWISKSDYLQLKAEYYDEDEYLVKTETAYEIKTMDGRLIPTRFELIPADKPGNKTIVTMDQVKFNISLSESFFSQQNMQKVR